MSAAPEEESGGGPSDATPPRMPGQSRRRALTPEQRRLLGRSRSLKTPTPSAEEPIVEAEVETPSPPAPEPEPALDPSTRSPEQEAPEERKRPQGVIAQVKAARAIELRHAILVISLLILLAGIFWIGRKFDAVKYKIMTRMHAQELEGANKFPGVSSEELIETALDAERRGDWQDAADRFIAAKRQNRALPGILFRIGKSAFDRGDLIGAETALDHAIKFGENIPVANYYRGLIAVRRHDLPAATRYFEAAANAEPFVSNFYYFWAEALRLDHHPREAIRRYEQAIQRTSSKEDATLCQLKIRLARLEAVEASQVSAELEAARQAGPLSVDWLMTDAALQIQAGKIAEATRLISEARDQGVTGLFLTCAGDMLFRRAAEANPEIATLIAPAIASGK